MAEYKDSDWDAWLEVTPLEGEGYAAHFLSGIEGAAYADAVGVGLTRKQVKKLRKQLKHLLDDEAEGA